MQPGHHFRPKSMKNNEIQWNPMNILICSTLSLCVCTYTYIYIYIYIKIFSIRAREWVLKHLIDFLKDLIDSIKDLIDFLKDLADFLKDSIDSLRIWLISLKISKDLRPSLRSGTAVSRSLEIFKEINQILTYIYIYIYIERGILYTREGESPQGFNWFP